MAGPGAGRRALALAVVAVLLPWPLLGPHHWWAFALATAAIVAALRLLLGPQWTASAGIELSPAQVLRVIVAFALVAAASWLLLQHVYASAGLRVTAPAIQDQAGFLFQALNEEILFRALMIGLVIQLARPTGSVSLTLISLGLALAFPAAHFLLYRYSNPMHLALSPAALATLFCAGVAMNNLYLAFRHIGFSWALHAGWNVIWLPAAFYDAATRTPLAEPQIFQRVLGAPVVAASACAMAGLSFVFLVRRPLAGDSGAVREDTAGRA
jgi:membrane protease YdiL (CAAX protease family)